MKPTTISITEGIDLSGKTTLVTGSSSGIGRECARVLALRGAHVLLANRNEQKTASVIKEFANEIGNETAQRCEYLNCDTASMKSVRAMVDGVLTQNEKIDLLFLNAGVFGLPYQITEDGFERTMATNYIGHFLMTHALAAGHGFAPNARIIATMAAGVYHNPFSKMDLATLTNSKANEKNFSRANASPNSKVMLYYLLSEFTRRTAGTPLAGITAIGADPGGTITDNVNQGGAVMKAFLALVRPFLLHSAEVGVAVLLWSAINPELANYGGHVFNFKLHEIKLPAKCTDKASAKLCWDTTEKALGLSPLIV